MFLNEIAVMSIAAEAQFTAEPFLLPYDPSTVAQELGFPDEQLVLPESRCMEDRPEERVSPAAEEPQQDLATVYDLESHRLRRRGLWIPESRNGLSRETASKLWTPHDPETEVDPTSAQAMIRHAEQTGLSMPGGLWMITVGQAVSAELRRPGVMDVSGMHLNNIAHAIDKIEPGAGRFHGDSCAARLGVRTIMGFAIENPDVTFETGKQTNPDLDAEQFERVLEAMERVRDSKAMPSEGDTIDVPMRPLIKREDDPTTAVSHKAQHVIAIGRKQGNMLWDTRAAWEAGTPGYALNIGHYGTVARNLSTFLGRIDPEDFITAATIYGAATIHNLPKRKDGRPPQVVYVGDQKAA